MNEWSGNSVYESHELNPLHFAIALKESYLNR